MKNECCIVMCEYLTFYSMAVPKILQATGPTLKVVWGLWECNELCTVQVGLCIGDFIPGDFNFLSTNSTLSIQRFSSTVYLLTLHLTCLTPNCSDLQGMKTYAKQDGDDWILNGSKVFISNGIMCGVALVAAVTNSSAKSPAHGMSLFLVDEGTPGFNKGRMLKKMGLRAQVCCNWRWTK